MRGSRTLIALLVALGLGGCGSSGTDNQAGLTSAQRKALVAQLETARGTAASHDLAGTKAAIGKFRVSVARLRHSGALSDATARSLRIGAARLLQRVESDNPPAQPVAPAPQTQTTPAPPPPPGHKKKEEKKPGKGHGKHGEKD